MTAPTEPGTVRLAKAIARSGVASRRGAERLVAEGRVTVNGELVHHPGHPVVPGRDRIAVDGQPIPEPAPHAYFLLYKPRGTVTTRDDPQGRRSVLDLVEHLPVRVEPVGRLDIETEGALLLTNDGELAHRLTHPSSQVPKRYLVKVWKEPDDKKLRRIERGIVLEDGRTAPCRLRVVERTDSGNAWIEITVTEGRNRLVRRLFEAVGHPVSKLRRESFATLSIRGMARGEVRPLTAEEVARLRDIAAGVPPSRAGLGHRRRKGFARPKAPPTRPLQRKKAARKARGRKKKPSRR